MKVIQGYLELLRLRQSYVADAFAKEDFLTVEVVIHQQVMPIIQHYILQIRNFHHQKELLKAPKYNLYFILLKELLINNLLLQFSRYHYCIFIGVIFTQLKLNLTNFDDFWLIIIKVLVLLFYQIHHLNPISIHIYHELASNDFIFSCAFYFEWDDLRLSDVFIITCFHHLLGEEQLLLAYFAMHRWQRLGAKVDGEFCELYSTKFLSK